MTDKELRAKAHDVCLIHCEAQEVAPHSRLCDAVLAALREVAGAARDEGRRDNTVASMLVGAAACDLDTRLTQSKDVLDDLAAKLATLESTSVAGLKAVAAQRDAALARVAELEAKLGEVVGLLREFEYRIAPERGGVLSLVPVGDRMLAYFGAEDAVKETRKFLRALDARPQAPAPAEPANRPLRPDEEDVPWLRSAYNRARTALDRIRWTVATLEEARQMAADARTPPTEAPAPGTASNTLCARCGHRNGEHCGGDGLGPCDVTEGPAVMCTCEAFVAPGP